MTRRFDKMHVMVVKSANGNKTLRTKRMIDNGKMGYVALLDKNGNEIPQDAVRIVSGQVVRA